MDIEFPLRLVWLGDIVDVQKRKGKREKGEEKREKKKAEHRGHGESPEVTEELQRYEKHRFKKVRKETLQIPRAKARAILTNFFPGLKARASTLRPVFAFFVCGLISGGLKGHPPRTEGPGLTQSLLPKPHQWAKRRKKLSGFHSGR
jgi:hypothetical protein